MEDVRAAFVGTIPERYNALLGPLMFAPVATATAERVASHAPATVLETACGTGILTRRLAEVLPPTARIVATDVSETMLAVARGTLAGVANVELAIADMTALRVDEAYDVVACQFGLPFVDDRRGAARSAFGALRPGGRWVVTTWASMHRNPAAQAAHETIGRFFAADDPPRLYEAPFALSDASTLVALAADAGFRDVRIETVRLVGRAATARDAAIGLVQGTPVLLEIRLRDATLLPRITTAVEHALAGRFGVADIEVPLEAIVMTATA